VTGPGVPHGEMVNFPWQTRSEFRAEEALLSGHTRPEDAPAGLRPVAEVLAALHAPPDPSEVAGWNRALAAFREEPGTLELPYRPRSRRLTSRLAAVAAAAAVALFGGGIAAAYAGVLPPALQKIAHAAIAAPDVSPSPGRHEPRPARPAHPVGPKVTGSAAYGLCSAYAHASASQKAEAFRKLVSVAGGQDKVAAFCGSVPHPGKATPPAQAHARAHARGQTGTPPGQSGAAHGHRGQEPHATPSHGNGKKPLRRSA
jgi:hypothetical protein